MDLPEAKPWLDKDHLINAFGERIRRPKLNSDQKSIYQIETTNLAYKKAIIKLKLQPGEVGLVMTKTFLDSFARPIKSRAETSFRTVEPSRDLIG